MNFVDLIIVAFALALATIGYERGLIASGLPLAGFVIGAAIGGRLGPALLAGGGESPYAPLITWPVLPTRAAETVNGPFSG